MIRGGPSTGQPDGLTPRPGPGVAVHAGSPPPGTAMGRSDRRTSSGAGQGHGCRAPWVGPHRYSAGLRQVAAGRPVSSRFVAFFSAHDLGDDSAQLFAGKAAWLGFPVGRSLRKRCSRGGCARGLIFFVVVVDFAFHIGPVARGEAALPARPPGGMPMEACRKAAFDCSGVECRAPRMLQRAGRINRFVWHS